MRAIPNRNTLAGKGLPPEDPVDEHDARPGLHGAPESQTARQTGISSMTVVYLADPTPKPRRSPNLRHRHPGL
jgi:hypothetical protein